MAIEDLVKNLLLKRRSEYIDEFLKNFSLTRKIINGSSLRTRVVIREGPGRTRGVGPSTGSGQRGVVPPRVRVGISRGRPVGPVYRGNNVILKFIKTILVDYSAKSGPIRLILISFYSFFKGKQNDITIF